MIGMPCQVPPPISSLNLEAIRSSIAPARALICSALPSARSAAPARSFICRVIVSARCLAVARASPRSAERAARPSRGRGRPRGRPCPVSAERIAEWHHHLVNAVDIGLIIARTRDSTAFILASSAWPIGSMGVTPSRARACPAHGQIPDDAAGAWQLAGLPCRLSRNPLLRAAVPRAGILSLSFSPGCGSISRTDYEERAR
jgi:hypothetical protein